MIAMKILVVRLCTLLGTVATLLACLMRPAIADAPAGRYTYTSTSVTVYDTKTKLTWQRAATATQYAMADAKTYCASAATATALGGMGWRVPTLKELQSLVDFSKTAGPFIDLNAFPGTPADRVWSATVAAGTTGAGWYVSFLNATSSTSGSTMPFYVLCVR
jgi:hypothetical protein